MTAYRLTASYGQHYLGSFVPGFKVHLTGGLNFLLKWEHGGVVPIALSACCSDQLHVRVGDPFCVKCGQAMRIPVELMMPFVREDADIVAWAGQILDALYPPLEASLLLSALEPHLTAFLSSLRGAGWLVSEIRDPHLREVQLAEHYHGLAAKLDSVVLDTPVQPV